MNGADGWDTYFVVCRPCKRRHYRCVPTVVGPGNADRCIYCHGDHETYLLTREEALDPGYARFPEIE